MPGSNPERHRVEWITPHDPPDDQMIETLRKRFAALPRIAEAWVIGQHVIPEDGSPDYKTTLVALILDPPLKGEPREEGLRDFLALTSELEDTGFNRDPDRGWVTMDEATIRANQDHVTNIYRRPGSAPPL